MSRRAIAVVLAVAATVGLVGCGNSASSPAAVKITGARVAGANTYQTNDWAISVPSGWRKFTTGGPGHMLVEWGNLSTHSILTVQTLSGIYRQTASGILSGARTRNGIVPKPDRATTIAQTPAHVAGARSASIVTVVKPNGTPTDATRELVVITPAGQEYLVTAETVGSAGFTADSSDGLAFLKSFTLSTST